MKPFKQKGTRRPSLCQQQRSAKRFLRGIAAAVALMASPRGALAMTADGALMTNTAMATYSGIAGQAVSYRTSYLASANVLICNPLVIQIKTATPTMAAPTALVTFSVCTLNNSTTTSAFNVVVTDQIPGNMAWTAEIAAGTFILPATSTITRSNAPALAGPWTVGNANPTAGQTNSFMRWTFSNIGIGKSACVTYTASVL